MRLSLALRRAHAPEAVPVSVVAGQQVRRGNCLSIQATTMETAVTGERDATVRKVLVTLDDGVEPMDPLIEPGQYPRHRTRSEIRPAG